MIHLSHSLCRVYPSFLRCAVWHPSSIFIQGVWRPFNDNCDGAVASDLAAVMFMKIVVRFFFFLVLPRGGSLRIIFLYACISHNITILWVVEYILTRDTIIIITIPKSTGIITKNVCNSFFKNCILLICFYLLHVY